MAATTSTAALERGKTPQAAALVAVAWTALGVVAAIQSVILTAGQPTAIALSKALGWQLPQWWAWALLTPVIVAADTAARRRTARISALIAVHGLMGVAAIVVHSAVVALADLTFFPTELLHPGFVPTFISHLRGRTQYEILSYLGIVGGWYAWDYARRHQQQALTRAALEAELSRSELKALQAQLQPHFLFNTLQAIAVLTERDQAAARKALERLAGLLRYVLRTSGRQLVPLEEELEFLRDYLEMEGLRFHDRLRVAFAVDDGALPLLVPHFILLPLVENALQHGLAPKPGSVSLEIRAMARESVLTLSVEDDGVGCDGDAPTIEGVGLTVTRRRLRQIYGDEASLRLTGRAGGGCETTVRLPAEIPPTFARPVPA